MNLTLDNIFRNPLRWGRCPINIGKLFVVGIQIDRWDSVGSLKKSWQITVFYGYRYWMIGKQY